MPAIPSPCLLPLLLALTGIPAPVPDLPADPPQIVFEKDRFDFGTIMQNEERKETVKVMNRGGKPLRIAKVVSSCGCAKADLWRNVIIPPGGEKTLNIALSGKTYFGKLKKHVKLFSNDPETPAATLWVILDVKADYWPDRRGIEIKNLRRGSAAEADLRIRSFMKEPLRFDEITCVEPFVKAKLIEETPFDLKKGFAVYRLHVTVDGSGIPADRHLVTTRIAIKSNAPTMPEDAVLVVLKIVEALRFTPERVDFDRCPRGETRTREIKLIHDEGKTFHVTSVMCPSPFITAEVVETGGTESTLRIRLGEKTLTGMIRGEIRVVVDFNDAAPLLIPVRGLVTGKIK